MDAENTSEQDRAALRELLDWFMKNLRVPPALEYKGTERALSWYFSSAKEQIGKTWELVEVLRRQGLEVQLLKTSNPGVVVYRRASVAAQFKW